MRDIIDGFLRFQREVYPQRVELFKQLATAQNPKALFVTCSDSRVVPELLTQRGRRTVRDSQRGQHRPVVRTGTGWRVGYGRVCGRRARRTGYRHLRALGLRRDGRDLTVYVSRPYAGCRELVAPFRCRESDQCRASVRLPRDKLDGLVRENVIAQLANLRTHPSVALALEQGRMNLHGWVYDIEMGRIDALDGATRQFVPLSESPATVAVKSY